MGIVDRSLNCSTSLTANEAVSESCDRRRKPSDCGAGRELLWGTCLGTLALSQRYSCLITITVAQLSHCATGKRILHIVVMKSVLRFSGAVCMLRFQFMS